MRSSTSDAAAEHRREKQPARFENAAELDQSAGQIADPVQGQRADDEVEAAVAKRDEIGVGGDPHPVEARRESREKGRRRQPLRSPVGARMRVSNAPLCAPRSSAARNCRSTSSRRSMSRSATSLCRKSTQPRRAARSRCSRQARRSNSAKGSADVTARATVGHAHPGWHVRDLFGCGLTNAPAA